MNTSFKTINRLILVSASAFGILLSTPTSVLAEIRFGLFNNETAFATGGFAVDEQDEMNAKAATYNTHFTFASAADRSYLADINVTITNSDGHVVFENKSSGPLLFLNLPSGKYTIKSTFDSNTKSLAFNVEDSKTTKNVVTW